MKKNTCTVFKVYHFLTRREIKTGYERSSHQRLSLCMRTIHWRIQKWNLKLYHTKKTWILHRNAVKRSVPEVIWDGPKDSGNLFYGPTCPGFELNFKKNGRQILCGHILISSWGLNIVLSGMTKDLYHSIFKNYKGLTVHDGIFFSMHRIFGRKVH